MKSFIHAPILALTALVAVVMLIPASPAQALKVLSPNKPTTDVLVVPTKGDTLWKLTHCDEKSERACVEPPKGVSKAEFFKTTLRMNPTTQEFKKKGGQHLIVAGKTAIVFPGGTTHEKWNAWNNAFYAETLASWSEDTVVAEPSKWESLVSLVAGRKTVQQAAPVVQQSAAAPVGKAVSSSALGANGKAVSKTGKAATQPAAPVEQTAPAASGSTETFSPFNAKVFAVLFALLLLYIVWDKWAKPGDPNSTTSVANTTGAAQTAAGKPAAEAVVAEQKTREEDRAVALDEAWRAVLHGETQEFTARDSGGREVKLIIAEGPVKLTRRLLNALAEPMVKGGSITILQLVEMVKLHPELLEDDMTPEQAAALLEARLKGDKSVDGVPFPGAQGLGSRLMDFLRGASAEAIAEAGKYPVLSMHDSSGSVVAVTVKGLFARMEALAQKGRGEELLQSIIFKSPLPAALRGDPALSGNVVPIRRPRNLGSASAPQAAVGD